MPIQKEVRIRQNQTYQIPFSKTILEFTLPPGMKADAAVSQPVAPIQDISDAIRFALEPINRYETTLINNTEQGLKLIENVGAENFGLLLDTFHMNIEEAVIGEGIRQMCGLDLFTPR